MNAIQPEPKVSGIRIASVNSVEQARRIEATIARRAYEIFERRGGMAWHELEDWRRAESEVRSKLCFGLTTSEDAVLVGCNVARFEEGSVEIWVAPKQLTICGVPIDNEEKSERANAHLYRGMVFRVVALPVEIDPSTAVANLKRTFLEIRLPMIRTKYAERNRAQAA